MVDGTGNVWFTKDMTNTASAKLTEARNNSAAAKLAWETARTAKARRDAAEDLEFWGNKAAYLANAR